MTRPLALLVLAAATACSERAYLARDLDASSPALAPRATLCEVLPRLAALPVIDGQLEPGLVAELVPSSQWRDGEPLPPGTAYAIAVAWHPDGLYFYAEVADPTRAPSTLPDRPWCGDALHLFADDDGTYTTPGAYDDPGTRQLILRAPSAEGETRRDGSVWVPDEGRGAWSSTEHATFGTSAGFVAEAFVRAADLGLATWTLEPAARVGFDVSLSVSGTDLTGGEPADCLRVGDYGYRYDPSGRTAHATSAAFCNPALAP